jgi:hypothetical protein
MRLRLLALAVASLSLTACWHVTVTSGATPTATVVDKPWQNSFIDGLVPPPEVNVREQCPNGVAKVETETSFVNGLVSAITWGIYTPIHLRVTCGTR